MKRKQNVVYKIDSLVKDFIQQIVKKTNSDGFSLLEIVVAVGVMSILVITGVMSYKGYQDNAKQRAVDNAAKEVYTKAYSTLVDEDGNTKPNNIEEEYNISSKKNVEVEVEELENNRLKVTALYSANPDITRTLITPAGGGNVPEEGESSNTPEVPAIKEAITTMTMRCDKENTTLLPLQGVQEGTVITIQETAKPETLKVVNLTKYEDYMRETYQHIYPDEDVEKFMQEALAKQTADLEDMGIDQNASDYLGYISDEITFKKDVSYEIKINGKFNILNGGRNCLRSIDFAEDSGLLMARFGINIEDVSANLPSSVISLAFAFQLAANFNDPDVSEWDTSNVRDMNNMFYAADSFNQNINSWDVSSVKNMESMFYSANSFNSPLNNWDVSEVKNMYSMFAFSNFNQPLDKWDTGKVENMSSMFVANSAFNQNINSWDVSKVRDISSMFKSATSFNQPLDSWDISSVEKIDHIFTNATSFNQPLNSWDVSNITDFSAIFSSATSFNQPLDKWNVSKATNVTSMFSSTKSFSQNLSSWRIPNIKTKPYTFDSGSLQKSAPKENQPQWGVE